MNSLLAADCEYCEDMSHVRAKTYTHKLFRIYIQIKGLGIDNLFKKKSNT